MSNQGKMRLHTGDKLQTAIDKPHASQHDHTFAYEHLQRRHAGGALPPVLDGTGNPVEDYADMLGIQR